MFAFFRHVIDGCVYELYFEETMKQSKKDILQFLQDLPEIRSNMTDEEKMSVIRPVFTELFKPGLSGQPAIDSLWIASEVRIISGLAVNRAQNQRLLRCQQHDPGVQTSVCIRYGDIEGLSALTQTLVCAPGVCAPADASKRRLFLLFLDISYSCIPD